MKTSIKFVFGVILLLSAEELRAQADSLNTNKEAIYNRPFVLENQFGNSTSAAIGGYVEGNTNYFSTDGVSDGFSMELRRFNIFVYASVGDFIKFFSEFELDLGCVEIAL
jgi:hypothetical protein